MECCYVLLSSYSSKNYYGFKINLSLSYNVLGLLCINGEIACKKGVNMVVENFAETRRLLH